MSISKFIGAAVTQYLKYKIESWGEKRGYAPKPAKAQVLKPSRSDFDDFVDSNSGRSVGESREELRQIVNCKIDESYAAGGKDMRNGILKEYGE